jgi:threonine synthase
VAGTRKLVLAGTIRPDDRVVAILTGHVLKDPGVLLEYHQRMEPAPSGANRPIEIDASLAAVEKLIR